jgi:hypothetical protein
MKREALRRPRGDELLVRMHLQGVFPNRHAPRKQPPLAKRQVCHRRIILPPASLRLKIPLLSQARTTAPPLNPMKKPSNGITFYYWTITNSSQCCFDNFLVEEIACCSATVPHLFCFSCTKRYAEGEIGKTKYYSSPSE